MTSAFIRQEVAGTDPLRPVYVMGESFGGLLALAVAMECPEIVSRVVLVGLPPRARRRASPERSAAPFLPCIHRHFPWCHASGDIILDTWKETQDWPLSWYCYMERDA